MTVVFQILTYVNSCLNPILYSGFTKKFMLIRDLSDSTAQGNNPATVPDGDGDRCLEDKAPYVPSTSFELSNKMVSTGA